MLFLELYQRTVVGKNMTLGYIVAADWMCLSKQPFYLGAYRWAFNEKRFRPMAFKWENTWGKCDTGWDHGNRLEAFINSTRPPSPLSSSSSSSSCFGVVLFSSVRITTKIDFPAASSPDCALMIQRNIKLKENRHQLSNTQLSSDQSAIALIIGFAQKYFGHILICCIQTFQTLYLCIIIIR